MKKDAPRPAIVLNMFATGLGIARSLGEQGVPVIGLTATHGIYGNFTRYAKTVFAPDSRTEPEALRDFLVSLGQRLESRAVVFPTRDDDLVFLDRFRGDLAPYFSLAIPDPAVLETCMNKWETYRAACRVGVPSPKSWVVESGEELDKVSGEIAYPCVMKPLSAHYWRQADNWQIVGARKAIGIASHEELQAEYEVIAQTKSRVLIQEMIPGSDEALVISACYLDLQAKWAAGFSTQKLIQVPETFGTGCVVRGTDCPELTEPTRRLLESIGFTGIAEVEYKRHPATGEPYLIEINPRPWDQHRLGNACGVDLVYLSYCEHAGLPRPVTKRRPHRTWIADDGFTTEALSLLWKRSPKLKVLLRAASGKRIYAVWSAKDPLPFVAYFGGKYLPNLVLSVLGGMARMVKNKFGGTNPPADKELAYSSRLGPDKNHS